MTGEGPAGARTSSVRSLVSLARRAGALALSLRGSASPGEVALRVEEEIAGRIARWPQPAVLISERRPPGRGPLSGTVVSPLDGPRAYAAGLPTWAVALATIERGDVLAGVVYVPAIDDLYVAREGRLRWNRRVLEPTSAPAGALVLSLTELRRRLLLAIPPRHRRPESPAYHLALVARGAAEAAVLERPRLWDAAPGIALLQASDALLLDLPSGRPVDLEALARPRRRPRFALAVRRARAPQVLERLRRA